MNVSQIYILIAVLTLVIIAVLVLVASRRRGKRLSPLAGLAFAFILAGIFFGEERLVGYGLMGVGVVLALVDIAMQSKGKVE